MNHRCIIISPWNVKVFGFCWKSVPGTMRRRETFAFRPSLRLLISCVCLIFVVREIQPTYGLDSNELLETFDGEKTCYQNRSAVSLERSSRHCLKRCRSNEDCKGRGRLCRCDGLCGKSCVKINKKCSPLSEFENGKFEVIPWTGEFGSKVIYRCDDGYSMAGHSVRFCQADGTWSGHSPSCVTEGECSEPPGVEHAIHDAPKGQKTFELGTHLYYSCFKGYYARGFSRTMCAGEGVWMGPRMVCSPRTCSHPGDIPNGIRLGDQFLFSQSVQYSCLEGYELVGEAKRTCQEDGLWSQRLPVCRPVKCPRLSVPVHSRMHSNDFSFGSVIRFSCIVGFRLIGPAVVRCQEDGTWSTKEPRCIVVECPHPGPFYNGYIDGQLRLTYGSTVTFRCFSLAKFYGSSSTITCTEHGNWSDLIPSCLGDCMIPPVENGTLNGKRFVVGNYINHGQEISYLCNEGFVNGSDRPRCGNGTWSVLPNCGPAPCNTRPPDINNGMTRFHSTQHGARAKYWCDEGNELFGNEYLTCEYGQWVGHQPMCNTTICTFPGSLENGKILIVGIIGKFEYRHYVTNVWHSTRIQFTCDKDYELKGPEDATCVHDKWSPPITTKCVTKRHPELPLALITRG